MKRVSIFVDPQVWDKLEKIFPNRSEAVRNWMELEIILNEELKEAILNGLNDSEDEG